MHCFRLLGVISLLVSFSSPPAWSQRRPGEGSRLPGQHTEQQQTEYPQLQQKIKKQEQKKRFEEMKRDSQKLLELATALKQYVDKSGEGILSMEVLHKAEEMEKLAKEVKNKMRGN